MRSKLPVAFQASNFQSLDLHMSLVFTRVSLPLDAQEKDYHTITSVVIFFNFGFHRNIFLYAGSPYKYISIYLFST